MYTCSSSLSFLASLQHVLLHLPCSFSILILILTTQAGDPGEELVHRLGPIVRRAHSLCCSGAFQRAERRSTDGREHGLHASTATIRERVIASVRDKRVS